MIDKTHSANIQSILGLIKQYENQVKGSSEATASTGVDAVGGNKPGEFMGFVKNAIHSVNELQKNSQSLATDFQQGKDVALTDVMLAMQKSSIAFEATLQIRNKVMRAYEDIKNMPV